MVMDRQADPADSKIRKDFNPVAFFEPALQTDPDWLLLTSFNEWYEDSQIEPTAGTAKASKTDTSESGIHYTGGDWYHDYGYLYLDILREELEK